MSACATAGVRVGDVGDRHVVVWGFGREGRAAVDVLGRHGRPASMFVVVDALSGTEADDEDVLVAGSSAGRAAVANADIIVKSPGVSPYLGLFAELTRGKTITGGTALWFAEMGSERNVGITGSKGKSTTATLVHHLLTALGEDVVLAGNIGRAPLEVLGAELDRRAAASSSTQPAEPGLPDRWVFELSSFQSAEVSSGPEFGILTSLFPEHLNWHGSVERYYADKLNLFADPVCTLAANFGNADVARLIAERANSNSFGVFDSIHGEGRRVVDADGSLLVDLSPTKLLGAHNASNVAGALTAIRAMGHDLARRADDLRASLQEFRPLAHRLEPVGSIDGRLVVDDSLSTAPQAAVAALDAYADVAVSIIVGGFDRGLDYQPLADACAARRRPTWVFGVPQSGERLIPLIATAVANAGSDHVVVEGFDDFDAAVLAAQRTTPPGGVILLSPGAPSFGRFVDYRERGLRFRRVLGLDETVGTDA